MTTPLNITESNPWVNYFFESNTTKGPDKKTVDDLKKNIPSGSGTFSKVQEDQITYTGSLRIRNSSQDGETCTLSLENFLFQNPGSDRRADKVVLYQPGLTNSKMVFFKVGGILETNVTRTADNKFTASNKITFPEGIITFQIGDEELRSQNFSFLNGSRFNRITVSFTKDGEGKTIASVEAHPDRTLRSDCDDCASRTANCFGSVWEKVTSSVSYSQSVVRSLLKSKNEPIANTGSENKSNDVNLEASLENSESAKEKPLNDLLDLESSVGSYHSQEKNPIDASAFEVVATPDSQSSTPEKLEKPKDTQEGADPVSTSNPPSPKSTSYLDGLSDFFGLRIRNGSDSVEKTTEGTAVAHEVPLDIKKNE